MFSVLRPFAEIPSETWQGYVMALEGLTAPQILMMVPLVLKKRWEFPPQPVELREIILEFEEQATPGVLGEMATWEPSDPNWSEVKEFKTKLREVIARREPERRGETLIHTGQGLLRTPEEMAKMAKQQKALTDYLATQKLHPNVQRSKWEIDAIKDSRRRRSLSTKARSLYRDRLRLSHNSQGISDEQEAPMRTV